MSKPIRCAIYTRKSSEEGLEQDFNSLDAQREACGAYVLSQASEGWKLLPDFYDDGGISGGTLERPALQRLLGDVKEGRIDIIVVYKVDRLTRSLLDFAKLVEAFDAAKVSFVSVTQSFNTTTSMGRLTLNMLLSFAQFEREVTAERIRDKIAQSKARGMWMGGTPPLGYQPDGNNSLSIATEHADLICDIYARYLKLGNVRLVAEELDAENIRTPLRSRLNGKTFGGCDFTRGQIHHILKSPIYAGDIPHKGKIYPGNHEPIIDRDQWEMVQLKLASHVRGVRRTREASKALLAGKLFDDTGEPLIPVHSSKPGAAGSETARKRYRYYVSRAGHHDAGASTDQALRIPAREIEQAVRAELAEMLADPFDLIERAKLDVLPSQLEAVAARVHSLHHLIKADKKQLVRKLLERATVHPGSLELTLDIAALAAGLEVSAGSEAPATLIHQSSIRLTRTGHTLKLVDARGVSASFRADPTLTWLLAQAHQWWGELAKGEADIATLARREKVSASWMTRVVRLAFLGPEVTQAVLDGTTRADLDSRALLGTGAVARDWNSQRSTMLGACVVE